MLDWVAYIGARIGERELTTACALCQWIATNLYNSAQVEKLRNEFAKAVAQADRTKRCPTVARPSRCNLPGDGRLRYKLPMAHQHSVQTHLGTAAADYDRVIRTFIPGYENMLWTICWWLSEVIPN